MAHSKTEYFFPQKHPWRTAASWRTPPLFFISVYSWSEILKVRQNLPQSPRHLSVICSFVLENRIFYHYFNFELYILRVYTSNKNNQNNCHVSSPFHTVLERQEYCTVIPSRRSVQMIQGTELGGHCCPVVTKPVWHFECKELWLG